MVDERSGCKGGERRERERQRGKRQLPAGPGAAPAARTRRRAQSRPGEQRGRPAGTSPPRRPPPPAGRGETRRQRPRPPARAGAKEFPRWRATKRWDGGQGAVRSGRRSGAASRDRGTRGGDTRGEQNRGVPRPRGPAGAVLPAAGKCLRGPRGEVWGGWFRGAGTPLCQVASFAKPIVRDARGNRGRGTWPGWGQLPALPPRRLYRRFSLLNKVPPQNTCPPPSPGALPAVPPCPATPARCSRAVRGSAPWGRAECPQRRGVPGAGDTYRRSGSRAPRPGTGETAGRPCCPPRFPSLVYLFFIIYLSVFICCLLASALPGLPAPGVCVGGVRASPCSIPAAPGAFPGSAFLPLPARARDAAHTGLGTAKASGCIGAPHLRTHRSCIRIDVCMFAVCFFMLFSRPIGRGRRRCQPCAPAQGGSYAGLGRPGPGRAAGSRAAEGRELPLSPPNTPGRDWEGGDVAPIPPRVPAPTPPHPHPTQPPPRRARPRAGAAERGRSRGGGRG